MSTCACDTGYVCAPCHNSNKVYGVPILKATPEFSGGSVDYYKVRIENPTTKFATPYTAECNDIIEALGMSYAEGNAFKAIWRSCAARTLGKLKQGQDNEGLYDAQKVEFFGGRMVAIAQVRKEASHGAVQSARSGKGRT